MSEKKVTLLLRSVQTLEEGEAPAVEQTLSGFLRQEDGELILTYREAGGENGLEGVQTTLRHAAGQVTLLREGPWRSQMVFQEGMRHSSRYETPYGALPLNITTHRVRSSLTEAGGELELEYDMELAGQSAGQTHFHLTVRESASENTCQ